MRPLPPLLAPLARGRVVLALAVAYLAFAAFFFTGPAARMALLWETPLDATPYLSTDTWRATLDALGEAGRAEFRGYLLVDLLHGPLFALSAASLLLWGAQRAPAGGRALRALALFPALAGVLDLVENALFLALLDRWPATDGLLDATRAVTNGKLLVVQATFGAILVGLLIAAWAAFRAKRR